MCGFARQGLAPAVQHSRDNSGMKCIIRRNSKLFFGTVASTTDTSRICSNVFVVVCVARPLSLGVGVKSSGYARLVHAVPYH